MTSRNHVHAPACPLQRWVSVTLLFIYGYLAVWRLVAYLPCLTAGLGGNGLWGFDADTGVPLARGQHRHLVQELVYARQ